MFFRKSSKPTGKEKPETEEKAPLISNTPRASIDLGASMSQGNADTPTKSGAGPSGDGSSAAGTERSSSGFGFSLPFGSGSSAQGGKEKEKEKDKKEDSKGKKEEPTADFIVEEEVVQVEFKDGDYMVYVHIIEARGLKSRDISGSSDPVCTVSAFGMKYNTEVKKKTLSCVWDRTFIFEQKNIQAIDVECSKINVSIFDSNGISRNDLIGSYEFGMSYVYNQKNHELYRIWVPLTDTTDEKEGIQGYVKLSITVLGPGDELVTHSEQEERERDGQEAILSSPKIKQEGHLVILECHGAEGLPKVDSLGKCDPFISVKFAGNPACKTSHKEKTLTPIWGEALEIPVMLPIMTDIIEVGLWDHEKLGANRLLSTFFLKYSEIPKLDDTSSKPGPRWYNFYGPSFGSSDEAAQRMSAGRTEGVYNYGRILMSVYDIPQNEPKLSTRRLDVIKSAADVKNVQYFLSFDLYDVVELPFESGTFQVVLAWGGQELRSERADIRNGRANFSVAFPEMKAPYPENPDHCPDVFVYLEKIDLLGSGKRVAYVRFRFKDIKESVADPSWVIFKEDKVVDAIAKGEFPGSILMKITAGKIPTGITPQRAPLLRLKMARYLLRANIYQGRNLIAADDDGLSDPYIILKVGGQKIKSDIRLKTLFPVWNQPLEAFVEYPEKLAYAPEVQILVYDKDLISKDDFMGRFSVPVSQLRPEMPPLPQWYPLSMEDYNFPMGDILASFQLIPQKETASYPPKDLKPVCKSARVEILVIGLRDLEPFRLLPIQKPYIEFDVGDRAKAGKYRTDHSKKPTGQNPNFLKTINLELEVPEEKLFCPTLNVKIYDRRFAGANNPMIGVCTVSLERFVPWMIEKPRRETGAGVSLVKTRNRKETISSGRRESNKQISRENMVIDDSSDIKSIEMLGIVMRDHNSDVGDDADTSAEATSLLNTGRSSNRNYDSRFDVRAAAATVDRHAAAAISGVRGLFNEPRYPGDTPEVRVELGENILPEYLKDREVIDDEMEDVYDLNPFHEFLIMRGMQVDNDILPAIISENEAFKAVSDIFNDDSFKQVGKFKGYIRVHSMDTPAPAIPFDVQMLMTSQPYVIRVYILKGMNLSPRDDTGTSDPYIVIELGDEVIRDKDIVQNATNDPEFFKCYQLDTSLPGPSVLKVSAFDHDMIGTDDLIGTTEVDLENRWFSKEWKAKKKKPLENRTLRIPSSKAGQGKLQMWVDIIPRAEIHKHPKIDISPPPKEDFEVRLIIWKARYMVNKDSITDQNDLFITADLTGCKKERTDVHLRAKEGKGSFNYRIIFPVKLPMKDPRLTLAAWDFDIFAPNDLIGETTISLDHLFKAAYHTKLAVPLSIKKESATGKLLPERDRIWLDVFHSDHEEEGSQGQICVSLEVMPKEVAEINPAGPKRDAPNMNPVLEPPERIKFDIFSPLQMLKELLGPDLYGRIARPLMFLCCLVLFVGIIIFLNQFAGIITLVK